MQVGIRERKEKQLAGRQTAGAPVPQFCPDQTPCLWSQIIPRCSLLWPRGLWGRCHLSASAKRSLQSTALGPGQACQALTRCSAAILTCTYWSLQVSERRGHPPNPLLAVSHGKRGKRILIRLTTASVTTLYTAALATPGAVKGFQEC